MNIEPAVIIGCIATLAAAIAYLGKLLINIVATNTKALADNASALNALKESLERCKEND